MNFAITFLLSFVVHGQAMNAKALEHVYEEAVKPNLEFVTAVLAPKPAGGKGMTGFGDKGCQPAPSNAASKAYVAVDFEDGKFNFTGGRTQESYFAEAKRTAGVNILFEERRFFQNHATFLRTVKGWPLPRGKMILTIGYDDISSFDLSTRFYGGDLEGLEKFQTILVNMDEPSRDKKPSAWLKDNYKGEIRWFVTNETLARNASSLVSDNIYNQEKHALKGGLFSEAMVYKKT